MVLLIGRFYFSPLYTEASDALEGFHRPHGEPIRQTMARLRNNLNKSMLTTDQATRPVVSELMLKQKIKESIRKT